MSALIELWNTATLLTPGHGSVSLADGHQHVSFLAEGDVKFPDPPAKELPGKAQDGVDTFIGYLKTVIYGVTVVAFLFVMAGMILGMRGRSNYAKDAVQHLPWLFGGIIGTGAVVGILDAFA